jgi:beta-glucanase (GH16 family)
MRRWKVALGVAVVLGLAIWGLGMQGSRAQPSGLGPATPKLRTIPRSRPGAKSAIQQPAGKPEFSAAFAGNGLDTSAWSTCYPYMDLPTGCTNFGNLEYQWYLSSQVHVSNGDLRLVAQRRPIAGTTKRGAPHEYYCRSGMVTTYPSLRFKYGYVQVVAKVPTGRGLWPAVWLAAANEHWPPEIDILETWGAHKAGEFFHPVDARRAGWAVPLKLAFGWHTFALDWSKSGLTWIIDGKVMMTVRTHIPHQKMYLIMDVAEYLKPSPSRDCSGTMLVSSVKVWRNGSALPSS